MLARGGDATVKMRTAADGQRVYGAGKDDKRRQHCHGRTTNHVLPCETGSYHEFVLLPV